MEYRQLPSPGILVSAAALFEKLNRVGVRYGVFKSSRATAAALAGDQDLDILVAREDYHRFCATASECGGMRSWNHRSLVSPGREDWFIPDFDRAKYLHLDVHTEVRLGGKFDKKYSFYTYHDIQRWHHAQFGICSIPIIAPEEEARITLSRIAFREAGIALGAWRRVKGDWAQEIDKLLFPLDGPREKIVLYAVDHFKVRCRVRKEDGGLFVRRRDLAQIRALVRAHCAAPRFSMISDLLRNALSAARYSTGRLKNRLSPGSIVDRRRPVGGGLLVALIAPDGMGKTTQVKRMKKLFGWKFTCATVYLGSGDGEGWWIRRIIRALYFQRRAEVNKLLSGHSRHGEARRSITATAASLLFALWGVLVAFERYSGVRRAKRMAARGAIVLCDRWPQAIEPGIMDGPARPRGRQPFVWMRKLELLLYARMARHRPDITVHLIGDYAASAARKPGDINRDEFDRRLVLMEESRRRDPSIYVLDAGCDLDDVSRSLFKLIWSKL
jgi:thymidylate kinase